MSHDLTPSAVHDTVIKPIFITKICAPSSPAEPRRHVPILCLSRGLIARADTTYVNSPAPGVRSRHARWRTPDLYYIQKALSPAKSPFMKWAAARPGKLLKALPTCTPKVSRGCANFILANRSDYQDVRDPLERVPEIGLAC